MRIRHFEISSILSVDMNWYKLSLVRRGVIFSFKKIVYNRFHYVTTSMSNTVITLQNITTTESQLCLLIFLIRK